MFFVAAARSLTISACHCALTRRTISSAIIRSEVDAAAVLLTGRTTGCCAAAGSAEAARASSKLGRAVLGRMWTPYRGGRGAHIRRGDAEDDPHVRRRRSASAYVAVHERTPCGRNVNARRRMPDPAIAARRPLQRAQSATALVRDLSWNRPR